MVNEQSTELAVDDPIQVVEPAVLNSNRSSAYCTLLGVLWQTCHAWITYGVVRRIVMVMGRLSDKWEITRNMPHCTLLGLLWQSCHAWITCRIICRVVIVRDRPHYMWNYLLCATEPHAMDRHGVTKILARSWQDHLKSQEIWQD